MDTLSKITSFVKQVQQLQQQGWTLKQINKWSYEKREEGEDVIYLRWGTKSKDPDQSYLEPSPIAKQKDYKEFFEVKGDGFIGLPKHSLYIFESGRIEFYEAFKNPLTGKHERKSLLYEEIK